MKQRQHHPASWILIVLIVLACISTAPAQVFRDTSKPFAERVANLVSLLTTAEKTSHLSTTAPAITRYGVPAYGYMGECAHGLMTTPATVFVTSVGSGSSWDPDLQFQLGTAISDESRAKFNASGGTSTLTYYAPVINLQRDPRWGRNEETYTEDPYLMKKLAVPFILGMQGNHPKYLKTIATAKHFAANNHENDRNVDNSVVDQRDLREYYFPAFKACVQEGKVFSVMNAHNSLNGVPCCASKMLLTDVLRTEWGFQGYVVTDYDDVLRIFTLKKYVPNQLAGVAACLKAGADEDLNSNLFRNQLPTALSQTLGTSAEIDLAAQRVFMSLFRLGMFDPPGSVPYSTIPSSVVDGAANRALALKLAEKSIVLLKNKNSLLPLNKTTINSIALIGPHADTAYKSGYSGSSSSWVGPRKAIQNKLTGKTIRWAEGCTVTGAKVQAKFDSAVTAARNSEVAVVFAGTDWASVSAEMKDRTSLDLPGVQLDLIKAVYAANPKTIVVLVTCGPLTMSWVNDSIPAIFSAWYGGEEAGNAIANVLFGDFNPGGKLAQIWPVAVADLPPIKEYAIRGKRTYMYWTKKLLYPFGYGLSYTTFAYSNLTLSKPLIDRTDSCQVSIDVQNTGTRAGDEIVQLYAHARSSAVVRPIRELKGFQRVAINAGEKKTVSMMVPASELWYWDSVGKKAVIEYGQYDIYMGKNSLDTANKTVLTIGQVGVVNPQNFADCGLLAKFRAWTGPRGRIALTMAPELGTYTWTLVSMAGRSVAKGSAVGAARLPRVAPGLYRVSIRGVEKTFAVNRMVMVE